MLVKVGSSHNTDFFFRLVFTNIHILTDAIHVHATPGLFFIVLWHVAVLQHASIFPHVSYRFYVIPGCANVDQWNANMEDLVIVYR